MSEILEAVMLIAFGASWPMNLVKSYKVRTTKGKSLGFLFCIVGGYLAGIVSKLINEAYMANISTKWYVLFFYVLNAAMVSADIVMYFRNRRFDKLAAQEAVPSDREKEKTASPAEV